METPVKRIFLPKTVRVLVLLAEDGVLKLDDRLAAWLPAFARGHHGEVAWRRGVTLRHLAGHCSGLPDSWPGAHRLRRAKASLAEYTAEELSIPLDFEPGTKVQYSSVGVDLLGAVVEAAALEPLPSLLERRVFAPIGMASTSLGRGGDCPKWSKSREVCLDLVPGRPNRAGNVIPSVADGGEQSAAAEPPIASLSFGNSDYWRELGCPSGGLNATAADLLCLVEHICRSHPASDGRWHDSSSTPGEGQLQLSAATVTNMTTCLHVSHQTSGSGCYGIGWRINIPTSERCALHLCHRCSVPYVGVVIKTIVAFVRRIFGLSTSCATFGKHDYQASFREFCFSQAY
eukprot:SAG31_NODE_5406_length_2555_cov_1.521580_2_plen_345_part_00